MQQKLLYYAPSSRYVYKKKCTNLNTLRPKNSYTVVQVVPLYGATQFAAVLYLNKGKIINRPLARPRL